MKRTRCTVLALVLVLVLMVSCLSACGSEAPSREEVFTKKPEEFQDFRVELVGNENDGNFLVYAQDTQQIEMTQGHNRVVSVDPEEMVFVFEDPDEQLLAMEPGDVFFAEASLENPEGVVVKVKEIQVSGNRVTILSDPVGMEDLFEYVHVDMAMPLAQVCYDETKLEEDMQIQILSGNAATPLARTAETMTPEWEWEGIKDSGAILLSSAATVDLGLSSSGNRQERMYYQHNTQLLLRSIRVQFMYDKETNYFYTNLDYIVETSWEASLSYEGSWSNGRGGMGQSWPVVSFFIPETPIQVGVETFLLTELSGGMKGSISQTESTRVGMSAVYWRTIKVQDEGFCEPKGTTHEAKLELEGNIAVSYGIRADVGIPFVVDVFAEGSVGVRAKGKVELLEDKTEENSVHDCERCLDGDIEVFGQVSFGVDVRIVASLTGENLVFRKQLLELTDRVGDFYASYRHGVDGGVECGLGTCPHLRWKVTVTVMTDGDGPAGNAVVRVRYPDDRTDEKTTDGSGVAVFYLPDGDNVINCAYRGQRGTDHVYVEGSPTTASLKLEDKRQLFVCYRFWADANNLYPEFDFTELQSILQMNYPDAVYLPIDEWSSHIQDTPTPGYIFGNHKATGLDEAYGVAEGDVILFVQAHPGNYGVRGYGYATARLSVFLLPEIPEEEDETEPTMETQLPVEDESNPEDIPFMFGIYQGYFSVISKAASDSSLENHYIEGAWYSNEENIWEGLRIDEDYRILESGSQWVTTQWLDPAPGAGMSFVEFQNNYSIHHDNLANYIYRVFPYIDRLMSGQWNEPEETLPPAD